MMRGTRCPALIQLNPTLPRHCVRHTATSEDDTGGEGTSEGCEYKLNTCNIGSLWRYQSQVYVDNNSGVPASILLQQLPVTLHTDTHITYNCALCYYGHLPDSRASPLYYDELKLSYNINLVCSCFIYTAYILELCDSFKIIVGVKCIKLTRPPTSISTAVYIARS